MTSGSHGFDGLERRGLMFVLSSPSGAGKTTLSRLLMERTPGLTMSVSATTRPKRPGEVDGRDYHFIDRKRFDELVDKDGLLHSQRTDLSAEQPWDVIATDLVDLAEKLRA